MTIVLVAPAGSTHLAQARYIRWARALRETFATVYAVAPLADDVTPLQHVSVSPDPADVLAALADLAAEVDGPLVIVDATSVGHPMLLSDLHEQTDPVSEVVVLPRGAAGPTGRTAGIGYAVAAMPIGELPASISQDFCGVLCVADADLALAADAWREAAAHARESTRRADVLLVAVREFVRKGGQLYVRSPTPYVWHRNVADDDAARLWRESGQQDARKLRIRAVAGTERDGLFQRYVLRRLSGPITVAAWRFGVGPNSVTAVSLATGLAAALLMGAGTRPAFWLAAALLQLSVVLDHCDGELARATGRESPVGAWFDRSGDRLKLFGVFAALAVAASSSHANSWFVASVLLTVTSATFLVRAASDTSQPAEPTSAGSIDSGSTAGRAVHAPMKRLAANSFRLPAAEQYLVLSIALVIGGASAALAAMMVLATAALVIELLLALLRRRKQGPLLTSSRTVLGSVSRAIAAGRQQLLDQSDPGLVAAMVGREDPQLSLLRRLVATRGGWLVPSLTWVVEAVVLLLVAAAQDEVLPLGFVALAVVAYHRYDIVSRQQSFGSPTPAWVFFLGLGAMGRPILYLVLGAVGRLADGLAVASLVWAVAFVAESFSNASEQPAST